MHAKKPARILVLGAGYAGLMSALRLARRAPAGTRVGLVNASAHFAERIRMHQVASGQHLPVRALPGLLARRGVELVLGDIEGIEPSQQRITASGQHYAYDALVVALGSRTHACDIPGANAHALLAEQATFTAAHLEALGAGQSVVVCGGGLTAIELASEIAERYTHLRVILACDGELASRLSLRAQVYLRAGLVRLGVQVLEHTRVSSIEPGKVVSSQGDLDADLCVCATGFQASPLLAQAGLSVNERGQALVDATLRPISLADAGIWVAGDAACVVEPVGAPLAMCCKTALPLGAHAADNVARALRRQALLPFSFGDAGSCVSLGRRDGVVQFFRRDGSVLERIIGGRIAAFLKERIARFTWQSFCWEARWGIGVQWRRAGTTNLSPEPAAAAHRV